MSRLRHLIAEAHRRSLWQVLGIYLVGAWVAYQIVLALVDGIGLPDWVPGFAIVIFVVGLPVVLATAFVNEGPPGRDTLRERPAASDVDPTLFPGPFAERRTDSVPAVAARPAHWLTWR
ncbi:MAG TPA: hypothetical protein VFZ73_03945, partial [Gemmatimonadaceae bacterium]